MIALLEIARGFWVDHSLDMVLAMYQIHSIIPHSFQDAYLVFELLVLLICLSTERHISTGHDSMRNSFCMLKLTCYFALTTSLFYSIILLWFLFSKKLLPKGRRKL
jgi:hypothetical protein